MQLLPAIPSGRPGRASATGEPAVALALLMAHAAGAAAGTYYLDGELHAAFCRLRVAVRAAPIRTGSPPAYTRAPSDLGPLAGRLPPGFGLSTSARLGRDGAIRYGAVAVDLATGAAIAPLTAPAYEGATLTLAAAQAVLALYRARLR